MITGGRVYRNYGDWPVRFDEASGFIEEDLRASWPEAR